MYSCEFDLFKFKKEPREILSSKKRIFISILFLIWIGFNTDNHISNLYIYTLLYLLPFILIFLYWLYNFRIAKKIGKIVFKEKGLEVNIDNLIYNYNISEMKDICVNFRSHKEQMKYFIGTLIIWTIAQNGRTNYISFKHNDKEYKFFFSLQNLNSFRQFQWILRFWKENNIEFKYMYRGNDVDVMFEP